MAVRLPSAGLEQEEEEELSRDLSTIAGADTDSSGNDVF